MPRCRLGLKGNTLSPFAANTTCMTIRKPMAKRPSSAELRLAHHALRKGIVTGRYCNRLIECQGQHQMSVFE